MYYDKFICKYLDDKIVNHRYFDEWYQIVERILMTDEFQKRKLFNHHKNKSVWDHSTLVSFNCFLIAKKFNLNIKRCAICGLLHDFYPYAWLYNEKLSKIDGGIYTSRIGIKRSFFNKHGFVHGKEAAMNVLKFFPDDMDDRMYNSIKNHMFPLTMPPKYSEGIVLTIVDKYNSIMEVPGLISLVKMLVYRKKVSH